MTEEDLMLTTLLDCRRVDLVAQSQTLSDEQQLRFKQMLARRAKGEPLQYILGHCDFMGIPLAIDPRALIPRPETEILVEHAVDSIKDFNPTSTVNILDLGTGSGNIAIALTKYIEHSYIRAIDISRETLDLARYNARTNGVERKIDFYCQDMTRYLNSARLQNIQFDLIIANPPYIPTKDLSQLPRDVQKEPRVALDGGHDGLCCIAMILELAHHILLPDGMLYIEIGDGQRQAIEALFKKHPYYQNIVFYKDYVGTDRIVYAQWKS